MGEGDKQRLQRRQMVKEFRLNGTNARLPQLDKSDPLNCIDSHFWLTK